MEFEMNDTGRYYYQDRLEAGKKLLWWSPLLILGSICAFSLIVNSLFYGIILALFPIICIVVILLIIPIGSGGKKLNSFIDKLQIDDSTLKFETLSFLFYKSKLIEIAMDRIKLKVNTYDIEYFPENCRISVVENGEVKDYFLIKDFYAEQWDELMSNLKANE
jgi:hypothetical protein